MRHSVGRTILLCGTLLFCSRRLAGQSLQQGPWFVATGSAEDAEQRGFVSPYRDASSGLPAAATDPPPGSCAPMTPANVFIGYQGASTRCIPGQVCAANEPITFRVQTFGYSLACATHTFSWNLGDGTPALHSQETVHEFTNAGSYTVTLTVTNALQSFTAFSTITLSARQLGRRRAAAPPSNAPSESATQRIVAAVGGSVTLRGGSSVTIPAGALASDQTVTLALMPSFPRPPQSTILTTAGPALVLTFGSAATPPHPTKSDGITFVINYGSNVPANIAGAAPLVDVVDEDMYAGGIPIVPCDPASACFTVPLSIMQRTESIAAASATLSPEITFIPPARFGPRIWNGFEWLAFPQGYDPTKKTLVLIHGIFSSVEAAFGPCLGEIQAQGGYQQVLGFNYDWTQRIAVGGQKFADFLNQLDPFTLLVSSTGSGTGTVSMSPPGTEIDLEAHSYGTLNALYAVSLANIKINNLILEGAPLQGSPIGAWLDHTPLLVPRAEFLMSVLANMDIPKDALFTNLDFQDVLNSGMWMDLRPGNPLLNGISRNALAMHRDTNYIKIAGTKSFMPPLLDAYFFDEADDGLMTSSSEADSGFNRAGLPGPAFFVYEQHDKLECNADVIRQVAAARTVPSVPPVPPALQSYGEGTVVKLIATPASGSTFTGWSGGCSGTSTTCTVTMHSNQSVTASFGILSGFTLTTSTAGTGSGVIMPAGGSYPKDTVVTLTATAAAGSAFSGWSGACAGTTSTCAVVMNADKSVTAVFNALSTYTLRTSTAGTGSGSITPAGGSYASGTQVLLTATAASGSTFAGWSGGGCSGTGSCTVTMNSDITVTATFNLSGSGYTYANWNCNQQQQCIAVLGHNTGSAGPFCSAAACDRWRQQFFLGATCTAQPMYPVYSAPPPGTCSNYPN
ncbi:MAG: hypothetical protein JWO56_3024 [Acidobacteria bacterium]|nr:hypothetical protein [Acidobacteriota bacterium]